jgi:bloom syndrome protein
MCVVDPGAKSVDTQEEPVSYTSSIYNMHSTSKNKPRSKPVVPSASGLGSFHSNIKNDGITGEFDGNDYPHSREMVKVLVDFVLKMFIYFYSLTNIYSC